MKSYPNVLYERVFFLLVIIIARVVVDDAYCTIFGFVKSFMTMFIKV